MKRFKFTIALLCAVSVVLGALGGTPATLAGKLDGTRVNAPTAPNALPYTWDLASDFRVFPKQANPNPDSYGNADTWSFMHSTTEHDPSTYALVTQFYPDMGKNPGLQGWQGPDHSTGLPQDGLPAFGMNTTGLPMVFVPQAIDPPGVFIVHPDSSQPAIVGWHSPFTGAIAIEGGVTDLNNQYGDGILWFIDKNSSTVASGSYPEGGAQLFKDGTGGDQLGNIPVNKGDFIYFLVAPGGNYYCDATQLDVTITMVSVSKPVAPALVSPANNSTIPKSRIHLNWTDVAYADRYRVVVKDAAMHTVCSLTTYGAAQVGLSLPRNGTYSWTVQACNTGGCSPWSEAWKFGN